MAIVTGTASTYVYGAAGGNREDLEDIMVRKVTDKESE